MKIIKEKEVKEATLMVDARQLTSAFRCGITIAWLYVEMHARMSRLRRSLSRSSIFGLNKPEPPAIEETSSTKYSLLIDKFSTPTTFPQLRQLVKRNNANLREIIDIFDERASLDFAYSKTMHKLSARLHKISQNSTGVIDQGWTCVAEQFDAQATIHSTLGSAIADDIVQPLRAIFNALHQTITASEQLVERELKKLSARRAETAKIKRQLYSSSRDLEKLDQLIDNDRTDNIKLSVKKRKLLDQVTKCEHTYFKETIEAEKQRRVTDSALRKSVERLEDVEKQRLAHCQTALGRFQRKVAQLGPNLHSMFERHMNALNSAVNADPLLIVSNLTPTCSAHHTIFLCDFYAENFGEMMGGERRRWALERVSALLHEHLEETQRNSQDVVPSNLAKFPLVEFIEYLSFKVDESVRSLDGAQNREYHRLARFQQKTKDKAGLPQTLLVIPLADQVPNTTVPTPPSMATTSSTDEYDYEQIYANDNQTMPPSCSGTPWSAVDGEQHKANDKVTQICRVLYDFSASSDDELDVRAGDCVIVERSLGDDWLVGYVISGVTDQSCVSKTGRFPASYVT
uniref:Nostrin n=2 Tax=Ascaris TaxID=6251 RepID=F1L0Z0_ASCSU